MLKLSITAFDSPVTVQDPKAVTQSNDQQAVISVDAGDTKTILMQWNQLERIQAQLTSLADLDLCTFSIEPGGTDVAEFAEQNQNADAPSIDGVENGGAAITAGGNADVDVFGTNLMGGQVMASASVDGDTSAGSLTLEVLNPGYDGNLYDVTVVDSGSGGLAVTSSVVDGRTVIEIDLGGSAAETCATVKAALDTALAGVVQTTEVGVNTTPITTVQAVTAFTGGIGTGLSFLFGGVACIVQAIDISADPLHKVTITTPDVTSTPGLAAGDTAVLKARSNDKVATANLTLV